MRVLRKRSTRRRSTGFWMRDKAEKYLRMITFFDNNESGELRYIDGYCVSDFLDNFVWVDDGSPCGVKIE